MTESTRLDRAHAAMEASPEDETARLRFYEQLSGSELFLLLEDEAEGDNVSPQTIEIAGGTYVLAFDLETRLTAYAKAAAPYAALSGRALCGMIAPARLGLALNLDVAPSAYLLPSDAISWLANTLANTPEETSQAIEKLFPPKGLPESFMLALDSRLAAAGGMASTAYLVGAQYQGGGAGHLLGVIDPAAGAETALTQAVSEVLTFSGLEAAALDIAFFRASDPIAALLAKEGLRFDLPDAAVSDGPAAPGLNPEKPPILR